MSPQLKLRAAQPMPDVLPVLPEGPPCELYTPGFVFVRKDFTAMLFCGTCGFPDEEHLNPFGKPEACLAGQNGKPCTLYREPGIVRGYGPSNAKMMFVGEAPGGDEVDAAGGHRRERFRPFIGGAGRLLSALCAHAGVRRDEVFVTNVVKCRPPENRTPTEHEMRCCGSFLIDEIHAVNPNVIAAMGETPLTVLTSQKGIGLHRGVPIEGFEGRKIFAQWHPAFIARAQHNWPFAVHDLVRTKAQSEFPEIRRVAYDIVRSAQHPADAEAVLRAARECGEACFDFETSGLSPKHDAVLMCGVTAGRDKSYVFDWTDRTQQLLQTLADDPRVEIIGQNVLYFDFPFAEEKYGFKVNYERIFDTMVAFHLCNSSYGQTPVAEQNRGSFRVRGAEKDLTMIASCHTDIPYWKSKENYKRDLRGVCGLDVIATHRSASTPGIGLKDELKAYDMLDLYYKHVLPVHPVLSKMTKRGVRIDQGKALGWSRALESNANELEATLREGLSDPGLNLNSPQQLMHLLYDKLGLQEQYVQDRKKGSRRTANAEALEALAVKYPEHAVVRTLVDIRHLRKMKSTYIDPALLGDGYQHPKFGVSKASTGRFNSWDPNAQNVPEELRDIWIPDDDDCILISSDWSQIEWRIGMVLSGDPVGLELLTSGVDNHSAVAAETLGKKIGPNKDGTCDHPDCTEHVTPENRYASKFIVYGLGYGRGAESIADGHKLPIEFVQAFIARFFTRFKVYAEWRERNVRFVKEHHYLANAFKRRRWWYTYQVTEVYNFPMQSNAGDMMYDALIALESALPKHSSLRLTIHDEVVVNGPKSAVKDTIACVRDTMQRTWPQIVEMSANPELVKRFYPQGWFCPADVHVGTDWAMCKSKDKVKKAERMALEKHLGLTA